MTETIRQPWRQNYSAARWYYGIRDSTYSSTDTCSTFLPSVIAWESNNMIVRDLEMVGETLWSRSGALYHVGRLSPL